jgi:hypothetical protein
MNKLLTVAIATIVWRPLAMQESPVNTLRIADAVLDAERQERREVVRLSAVV